MTDKPVSGVPGPLVRGSERPETWFEEGCFITEWLNEAEQPGLSIARARVPAGKTTRWHSLTDITERYLVLAGSGRAEIGDGEPLELVVGDSVTIAPGQRQRITNIGSGPLEFLAICTPRFVTTAYIDLDAPRV